MKEENNIKLPETVEEFFQQRYAKWDNGVWGQDPPEWYKQEKENTFLVLKGLRPIKRILYCGNCKQVVHASGIVQVLKSKHTIRRDFDCPECSNPIKVDFLFMPGKRAIC